MRKQGIEDVDLVFGCCMVKEPQDRLRVKRAATEIKQHLFFEDVKADRTECFVREAWQAQTKTSAQVDWCSPFLEDVISSRRKFIPSTVREMSSSTCKRSACGILTEGGNCKVDCPHMRGTTADSRSFIPAKSLRTDDDDEDISDDQISSTPRSIESSFEIFKDSLPKSSSFPLYDEPIYDVYDDDIFTEVLDLDQPVYNEDTSKVDTPLELVFPLIPCKTTNMLTDIDQEIGMIKLDHNSHLDTVTDSDTKFLETVSVDTDICIVDPFYVQFNSTCEECSLEELLKMPKEFDSYPIFHRLQVMWKSLQDGANDTEWKYPGWFSQPHPPPSCGQQISFYDPEVPPTPVV